MAKPYIPYVGPTVTRDEAKARGLKRFFTGIPCLHGHLSERWTSGRNCMVCLAVYQESEKGQATATAYNETHRTEAVLRSKTWRIDNPEKAKLLRETEREPNKLRMQISYQENPEKHRAQKRAAYAANPESFCATMKEWRALNPELVRTFGRNYRARKRNASGSHTLDDIKFLKKTQKLKCAHSWCRVSLKNGYHVDHIIPLAKGGSNDRKNLQLLCASCNHHKNARHPIDFARQNGLLL